MPSLKIHILFNSFLLVLWMKFFLDLNFLGNALLLIVLTLFNLFLSIFPDIDTPKSKIRNYSAFAIAAFIIVYYVLNSDVNSIQNVLLSFIFLYLFFRFFPTKHRGITHKFWFSILLSFILVIIFWFLFNFTLEIFLVYYFYLLSGYLSHLLLDMIF
jgi:membrane-bound metal-dependent hydrolase YbcI (DUF457 family)